MKILVVDDFSTMRRITINILKGLGYHDVTEAADGHEALAALEAHNFDFVITDWNMPCVSGLELLQKIRSIDKLSKIPVLMVTAESKREQIVIAAKAGVNGYVVKPFTATLIKEKIEYIFEHLEK